MASRNRWPAVVLTMWFVFISGCFSTKVPLPIYAYESDPSDENLIVFIRGMGGTFNCLIENHACFEEEGFVEAVRRRDLPFDMVAPDTHFGYYQDRTLTKRIRADVIVPAQAAGYRNIWLVGISLGGLGVLLYLMEHPDDINGVLALGPYLGDDAIIEEITAAGGLARWMPGAYDPNEDWERMLWDWLKHYPSNGPGAPPIYLGLAKQDVYLPDHQLLADYLPPGRTIYVEGKHRFSSFAQAWNEFLDQGLLK